jgi:hypothetical protein
VTTCCGRLAIQGCQKLLLLLLLLVLLLLLLLLVVVLLPLLLLLVLLLLLLLLLLVLQCCWTACRSCSSRTAISAAQCIVCWSPGCNSNKSENNRSITSTSTEQRQTLLGLKRSRTGNLQLGVVHHVQSWGVLLLCCEEVECHLHRLLCQPATHLPGCRRPCLC